MKDASDGSRLQNLDPKTEIITLAILSFFR